MKICIAHQNAFKVNLQLPSSFVSGSGVRVISKVSFESVIAVGR